MPHTAPTTVIGFDIQKFITKVNESGVLKPTKWLFTTVVPPGLKLADNLKAAQDISFWATASSVPGQTFMTQDILRFGYGAVAKYPYMPSFQPLQVTFICDGLGTEWTFFKEWMNMIIYSQGKQSNQGIRSSNPNNPNQLLYEGSYPADYLVDSSEIAAFVDSGEEILRIQLREAYPCSVSDMKMDWNDKGGPASFNVVFMYTDWTLLPKQNNP